MIQCRYCKKLLFDLQGVRDHEVQAHGCNGRFPGRTGDVVREARGWFDLFGADRTLISENGARYFKLMLEQLERERDK